MAIDEYRKKIISRLESNFNTIDGWKSDANEYTSESISIETTNHTRPLTTHIKTTDDHTTWTPAMPHIRSYQPPSIDEYGLSGIKWGTTSAPDAFTYWLWNEPKPTLSQERFKTQWEECTRVVLRIMFDNELTEPEKFYKIQEFLATLVNTMYEIDADYAEEVLSGWTEEECF